MISANELRIGNFAEMDGELIAGLMALTIHEFEMGRLTLNPILLSEDWLVRFGFLKIQSFTSGYFSETVDGYKMRVYSDKDGFYFSINPAKSIQIKYVHQLQNLFFALTGNELTAT